VQRIGRRGPIPRDPAERFWARVEKSDGCWLWIGPADAAGYGRMGVGSKANGTKGVVIVHRFSWQLAFGPIPDGMFVCHRCDTPACVRPDHLFLGSPADNTHDSMTKQRFKAPPRFHGEQLPAAKLTESDVREIRRLAGQETYASMARRLGVTPRVVRLAARSESWTHVE
jgi:hypothetical protein